MGAERQIGQRLRDFGDGHYNSLVEFARALEISPQQLNAYVSGQRIPGNAMQSRLRDLGCDIEWLMTGKRAAVQSQAYKTQRVTQPQVEFNAPMGVSPEVKKKMQQLARRLSKLSADELDKIDKLLEAFTEGETKRRKKG